MSACMCSCLCMCVHVCLCVFVRVGRNSIIRQFYIHGIHLIMFITFCICIYTLAGFVSVWLAMTTEPNLELEGQPEQQGAGAAPPQTTPHFDGQLPPAAAHSTPVRKEQVKSKHILSTNNLKVYIFGAAWRPSGLHCHLTARSVRVDFLIRQFFYVEFVWVSSVYTSFCPQSKNMQWDNWMVYLY